MQSGNLTLVFCYRQLFVTGSKQNTQKTTSELHRLSLKCDLYFAETAALVLTMKDYDGQLGNVVIDNRR